MPHNNHPTTLSAPASDPFMGHIFGDWSHGIDHELCGACRVYRHAFDKDRKLCPNGLGPGARIEPAPEDFGRIWAIRPELTPSDIYGDQSCPDVMQFESQERLLGWLDSTSNGIPNRKRRWYGRIAVRALQPLEGAPHQGHSFAEFLASGQGLAPWPQTDVDTSLRRTLYDEDPAISLRFGEDWDFESIVRASRFRPGHQFAGRVLVSFPDQIVRVIDDLQAGFRQRHPKASAEAECCFLESWDVLRHVAEFCGKVLATSFEARDLIARAQRDSHQYQRYVEDARQTVAIQVAVYCRGIRDADVTASAPSYMECSGTGPAQIPDVTAVQLQTGEQLRTKSCLPLERPDVEPDPLANPVQREKAIVDFMDCWGIPTRLLAAKQLGVHYQDLNKWKLHRQLAKNHSLKQDRIEKGILKRRGQTRASEI
jgi:hypothetical protein